MNDLPKKATPPYTTYKSFVNLISDLRENGMPEHITRSIVKGSNSGKATMTASLKSLNLIDEELAPTNEFRQLVDNEDNYSENLRQILENAYDFLLDNSINIQNTTTEKVVEKFKEVGASGSTVSKCIAFFLGAANAAGLEVSPRVKAPAPERKPAKTKKPNKSGKPSGEEEAFPKKHEKLAHAGMEKITVPLRDMDDGIIYFPKDLETDEAKRAVKMAVFILENFYGIDVND